MKEERNFLTGCIQCSHRVDEILLTLFVKQRGVKDTGVKLLSARNIQFNHFNFL